MGIHGKGAVPLSLNIILVLWRCVHGDISQRHLSVPCMVFVQSHEAAVRGSSKLQGRSAGGHQKGA